MRATILQSTWTIEFSYLANKMSSGTTIGSVDAYVSGVFRLQPLLYASCIGRCTTYMLIVCINEIGNVSTSWLYNYLTSRLILVCPSASEVTLSNKQLVSRYNGWLGLRIPGALLDTLTSFPSCTVTTIAHGNSEQGD